MEKWKKKKKKGFIVIISAPSGAGKSTILKNVLKTNKKMKYSISVTTRLKRSSEIDKKDYFFTSKNKFLNMINDGEFLEYTENYGYLYGTPKDYLKQNIDDGIDMICDVDYKGYQQILKNNKEFYLFSIFILPPSLSSLRGRLLKRGEDFDHVIEKRLSEAEDEIKNFPNYDYFVVNENLDEAVSNVCTILNAEKMKCKIYHWS